MKTLHFDASGNYTGYSVNHSSWTERALGVGASLASALITTAVTTIASWYVGTEIIPKLAAKQQQQQNQANTKSDEFEDPK